MARLTFRTTRARVATGVSIDGVPGLATWHLGLRAHLSKRETLTVTTGEDLQDFVITVTFSRNTGESLQWWRDKTGSKKAIGAAHYFASRDGNPVSLIFQAYLDEPEYSALTDFARAGCLPREVTVEVEGIEYGSAPDGSAKRWDTAVRPILPITSVNFSMPVSGGSLGNVEDDVDAELAEPPPSWAVELLSNLRTLVKLQTWTFYGIIAICIILFVLLRH